MTRKHNVSRMVRRISEELRSGGNARNVRATKEAMRIAMEDQAGQIRKLSASRDKLHAAWLEIDRKFAAYREMMRKAIKQQEARALGADYKIAKLMQFVSEHITDEGWISWSKRYDMEKERRS